MFDTLGYGRIEIGRPDIALHITSPAPSGEGH